MGKYVYIYYAGRSVDAGNAEAWGKWFGELGDKLIDGGNPFAEGGKAVSAQGAMDVQDAPATGYSIVKAESIDDAVALSKGCPLLASDTGAVCVYEALPM
jgi:hypothetical protein